MMSHPKKKQRLVADAFTCNTTFDALSVDELALIFEYLSPENIMCARLNRKMRSAATKTVVPINSDRNFCIDSVKKYNAVAAMTTALPNFQQIEIRNFKPYNGLHHKFIDGDDPNIIWTASTANWPTCDVEILHSFRRLRELRINTHTLNGRYRVLFDFPLLQKLTIVNSAHLKWDLAILSGLPLLKELKCFMNGQMTGSISSLSVLKGNLVYVAICLCKNVQGNFMDLADFLHLQELYLMDTSVIGDIRDIGEDDFPSLEMLSLPSGVYGGSGYEFQRISDAPNVIEAVSFLGKRLPRSLFSWYACLSSDSPDWYVDVQDPDEFDDESEGEEIKPSPKAPLHIEFVKAGPRQGWRWTQQWEETNNACEVNWLDPEPSRDSSGYQEYIAELRNVEEKVVYYEGFQQPPSESEYKRIAEEVLTARLTHNN